MKRTLPLLLLALAAGCRERPTTTQRVSQDVVEPVAVAPFAMGQPDVVLLMSGGSNGRLEFCSCCGIMPGGLSRRSGIFRSYEAAFPHTLRIDTGDAFWVNPTDIRNDFVARGYRMLGYDVVVLGDQEWAVAPSRLAKMLPPGPVAYLSTTVQAAEGGPGPAVVDSVRKEWDGGKIAFVSDFPRDATYLPAENSATLSFRSEEEMAKLVAKLKSEGYPVVLIAHAREEAIERVVGKTQADLVLRGHINRADGNVLSMAGRPLLKVGGADYVSVAALKLDGGRIAKIEYRLELIDDHWPIDERFVFLYQSYTHADAVQALDKGRTEPIEYVASSECGRCHAKQYEFWKTTAHSGAFATLVREKRQDDESCIVCHSTGAGLAGGFESIAKTPAMANVNCQDCHRLNVQEHRRPGYKKQAVQTAACEACHTPLSSPTMETGFDEMLKSVACPKN